MSQCLHIINIHPHVQMPLGKSHVLKQLSREQLARVIFVIIAEDCGSPAGANRKAAVNCTGCSLDTRQEAEYCEAVASFNGPDRSVSHEQNSFNGPSSESHLRLQQRLLSYAPQQQEKNVPEHKHVCLLSAQLDRWGGGA